MTLFPLDETRPQRTSYVALVLILIAVASSVSFCASDSPTKSYQTIGAINTAVQSGVRAFGVIYQAKKVENPVLWADRYDKVQNAYVKYQAVATLALEAAKTAGESKSIIAVVREAGDEVLNVLAAFGVQP